MIEILKFYLLKLWPFGKPKLKIKIKAMGEISIDREQLPSIINIDEE